MTFESFIIYSIVAVLTGLGIWLGVSVLLYLDDKFGGG